jgi:NADH:ubiquinone oxidoreductase subunit H
MDRLFQNAIENFLQYRYDRIVDGYSTWPWTFGIMLLGFLILLIFVLLVVLYTTLLERKLLGWLQIRLGPNRVGPWGLLQPIADMIKLLVKEDIVPCNADKWLHLIAPLVIFIPTMLAFVVMPFGKGTVELPQQYVSPTFDKMWVEWITPEAAVEKGYPGPGWMESSIAVETNEEAHKTFWVLHDLKHTPLFVQTNEDGTPLDKRYRIKGTSVLQNKPSNPNAPPEYAQYFLLMDYGSSGRNYDVIEIRWLDNPGDKGVIELGLNGQLIDEVEKDYSAMMAGIGPDVLPENRYNFGTATVEKVVRGFTDTFASAVAINNRSFGTASMVPAFGITEAQRHIWRDLYTPDLKGMAYVQGTIDPAERKGNLVFTPSAPTKVEATTDEVAAKYDLENLDWRAAGGAFRIRHITGGGYTVDAADPNTPVAMLAKPGDSIELPLGGSNVKITLKDRQYYNIYIMGKNLGIGILYIFAVMSLTVLGIFMAGFGSNNKWSLYGAMRSAAQMISYEIPMTLAVLGPIMMAGSLSTVDMVEAQRSTWFFIPQFIAFFIYIVCMTAEVNRNPFDLPEAESELVAGFHTEYTGLKFGFFFLAEYANMFVASALMTMLFFGGYKGPEIPFLGEFISSFFWFMLKTVIWLCIFVWFRATFPRFRIDQLMDYAWKVLLPLALINIIVTGYLTYCDWYWPIWRENNWLVFENYVKPLFTNNVTKGFAIPIIGVIVLMIVFEVIGAWRDKVNEAKHGEKPL